MAIEIVVKKNNLIFMDSLNQMPEVNDVTLVEYTSDTYS